MTASPRVPFVDLPAQYAALRPEMDEALHRVMASGQYVLGHEVAAFEEAFARQLGARHCVGVSSGLDALRLALLACDIGPGDEVIVPANTFIATALAVSAVGATPVLVDCEARDSFFDVNQVQCAVTSRTRALMPVHLYGKVSDQTALLAIARERGLTVIEDACQSHGARIGGKAAGTFGRVGCFSFYPNKNLGAAGDGGAVVTGDPEVDQRLRMLRNYGQSRKYVHDVTGFNHRLDAIQAAILRVKLPHLDAWNARRRSLACRYIEALAGLPIELPDPPAQDADIVHLFVIRTDRRDALQQALSDQGIESLIHYPVPIHLQKAYASLGLREGTFPVAESLASRILSLPLYPEMTEAQLDHVVWAVRGFFEGRHRAS